MSAVIVLKCFLIARLGHRKLQCCHSNEKSKELKEHYCVTSTREFDSRGVKTDFFSHDIGLLFALSR